MTSTLTSRPRRRASAAGLVLVLLALVLTACGGSSDSGSDAKAGATTLQDVKDQGVLVIGTEGTYPPFTFHEGGNGELTGYDVDVAKAVADKLGVKAEFKETQWDAIFAGLEAGRFDMIANQVSITPERQADYAFSQPYTVSPGVVVTKAGDDSISSFDDLQGKTTAQSLTSNWYEMAKKAGANVQPVEGWAQAVTLVKQGRVDATVNDKLTFLDWQQKEGDDSLKIAVTTSDVAHNAFAFRQGSDDLVKAVDQALAELRKDGTLAQISEKYFGTDVSQ